MMAIDNSIKADVLPLVSNYACASREFVLFFQSNKVLCQCLPFCKRFCLWSRRVLLFKIIIIDYLYVGTEPHDLTR